MEFNEIEKSVLRDLNPPKEMEPQDKNCWYALRGLYQVYHAQSISRDQAKKAKLEIAENHARICRLHNQYFASVSQTQEFIRLASVHMYNLAGLKSKDDVLDTLLIMISCMLGEDSLERMVRKNLEDENGN